MIKAPPVTDATPTAVRPSWAMVLLLAAQHVVVLFSGIILVPVMLVNIHGLAAGDAHYLIFATSVCAAGATLLQLVRGRCFGLGAPMFMGTSGAYLTCAHGALFLGGTPLLAAMVMITAPLQLLFSYSIRFMRHILTPTVGGVVIMLAVVGLLTDSVATWTGDAAAGGLSDFKDIATGLATMGVMVLVEWFGGSRLRPWGLPLGILAGCGFTMLFGQPLGTGAAGVPWVGLPDGHWPGLDFSPDDPAHWTLAFTFALAVLATSIKYAGDAMVLQKVTRPERRKVDYDALQGGLYANSLSMILSGLAGGMPASSHSSNIPLMAMTGVATRRVAAVAALLMAAVSLSPRALDLLVGLPQPVVGGVGVVLVAHLFSSGMQLVAEEMNHRNGLIAGLSLCAGLVAAGGKFFPGAFSQALDPLVRNGVAVGGLVAVLLTLMTHLAADRGTRFSLRPNLENLRELKGHLVRAAARLRLSGHIAGFMELACEEVFLYMRAECEAMGYDGPVTFVLRRGRDGVVVEASGGTRFGSEADEMAARDTLSPEVLDDDTLNGLGLALLGRIATGVSHVTIAGYTYIGFTISDHS
jgi:xanthine/uracil permease